MYESEGWSLAKEPEEIKVGWRKLTSKTFVLPDGSQSEFMTYGGISDRHGAVIALTPDNEVIVAEQFRVGPEIVMQELPGGNIDTNEDPQEAVMRELREETGYISDDVTFLGEAHKDAYMNATWYFYMARNCHQAHDQELDHGEYVDVRHISIDALIKNAKAGKMSDANAVLMAYDTLKEIAREQ